MAYQNRRIPMDIQPVKSRWKTGLPCNQPDVTGTKCVYGTTLACKGEDAKNQLLDKLDALKPGSGESTAGFRASAGRPPALTRCKTVSDHTLETGRGSKCL
jgi:hypothetical protein